MTFELISIKTICTLTWVIGIFTHASLCDELAVPHLQVKSHPNKPILDWIKEKNKNAALKVHKPHFESNSLDSFFDMPLASFFKNRT